MRRFHCLLAFQLTVGFCSAQNLLPNGNFEQYSALPTSVAQYSNSIGWTNCNGTGSPDYFHISGSGLVQLPNSYFATVTPHGDSAVMGLIIWHSTTGNFREYVSHALSSPLTIGESYTVTFWITNGGFNGNYGGYGVDQMSVAFSTMPLTQTGSTIIPNVTPVFINNSILYNNAWQQITFTFSADSAFNYITFGSFDTDAATTTQLFQTASIGAAYYFIDDISVTLSTGIGEATAVSQVVTYPNPFTDEIHFAAENAEELDLYLFDCTSRKIMQQSFTGSLSISTGQLAKGVYFYEIASKNGTVKTGKVVKN